MIAMIKTCPVRGSQELVSNGHVVWRTIRVMRIPFGGLSETALKQLRRQTNDLSFQEPGQTLTPVGAARIIQRAGR